MIEGVSKCKMSELEVIEGNGVIESGEEFNVGSRGKDGGWAFYVYC